MATNSAKSARPKPHTVRLREADEAAALALMAASTGTSESEWIAVAARQRMRAWLRSGWGSMLNNELAEKYKSLLEEVTEDHEDFDLATD